MADQEEDQGITAYHGSPHEFDQFDLSKIGTGEGAQAYGHGLYFAESEPIAKSYRDTLSVKQNLNVPTTRMITAPISNQEMKAIKEANNAYSRTFKSYAQEGMQPRHFRSFHDFYNFRNEISDLDNAYQEKHGSKIMDQINNVKLKAQEKGMSDDQIQSFLNDMGYSDALTPHAKAYREAMSEIAKNAGGHMYEVSINAHPDHFLDWDKPLSEQSEHVRNTISNLLGNIPENKIGREIYEEAKNFARRGNLPPEYVGNVHENASRLLKDSGLHGIKYLDAGSRREGDGTRNYVVFDDKLVNVKRRYARGGEVEREGLAGGGSPDNDMIRDALSRVASPFSDNPELAAKAVEIANQAYKVPTGNITAGPSYYGFKGPMDVSDIQTTVEPLPDVSPAEKNPMSWEDFYKVGKGGTMINLGGDRSRLGRLTHINGKELAWPVDLHAGPEYMLEPNPGAVWANAPGHTSGLRNKILQAAEKGSVYGVYTPMGPKTVDSSFQMFDALLSQIAADPPSKKVAKQLDDSLKQAKFVMGSTDKAVKDREKEKDRMENWPGILNALEAREHAKTLPGSTRSLIVKYLDRAAWHKLGLPHIGMTRAAITSPDLVGAPANMMGHRIVELSPEEVEETAFKHNTYKSPTGGKYVGDVPLVQRQYAMPDVMDQFLARRVGSKGDVIMHPYSLQSGGRDAARKMLEEQKQMQPVSQRMLDSIQQGLERQTKYGLKDGGKVEDREEYAIGGNPGDLAGGGFGTGNVGGGSSISSGGSMAEARAADRESVSGYSASNSGGGGGRDSYPSRDRSIGGDGGRDSGPGLGFDGAEVMSPLRGISNGVPMAFPERSHEQMMRAMGIEGEADTSGLPAALRPGGNIGAALAKEALTPDLSTANSPLASGISSYDQNALNAQMDRMRAAQQAERNESYERSVVGPTTPQINVPNAGDLYGATDAQLAVNQKPSGMFGQPEFGTTRFGQNPMQSGFPKQSDIETRASGPFSQPNRPITPTPFSGYPQEVQSALNPVKPDSAFGQTLIDPTGKYTQQALDQMNIASDATTMLNSPTLAGAFVRAFTPTPTPATAEQQADIERMYRGSLNTGVPANFATPEGMAQRYGAPSATPLARPGQTSTAYLSAGPSASTGRQDMPIGATSANQTPRENFSDAFAAARARGDQTFSWTNPATGQTMLYTTQLARKQGGRVPSLKEPEQWECKEKR